VEPGARGSRRGRVWAAVVVGLALVALGHLCAAHGGDFRAFYDAGEAALRHGDVYAQGPRMRMNVFYAPTFSLIVMPLTLLPPYLAAWIWYLLKLAAVAFLARWVYEAVRAEAPDQPPRARAACVALPFVVALNPVMSDFRLGQANLFVLLFTVLAVRSLERRRPVRGALYFSLAAVKITPLALLPWLVLRRQWRFFGGLLLVGAAWLAALAAWWGPARVPELFREWVRVTATRKAVPEIVAFFENQSLQGVAARLARLLPALEQPLLGVAAYQWIWIVGCAAICAVLVLAAARDRFRPALPTEEFALASLLMLLASSDSRWAHHVQLLVPLAVLAALSARVRLLESWPAARRLLAPDTRAKDVAGEEARPLRRWLAALFGAGIVVLVVLGRDVVGPTVNHAVRTLSLHTAFDLALVVFLARRLLRRIPADGVERPVSSLSAA